MVTETVILRPTSFYQGSGGNSADLQPYPAETLAENYHLLVSEITPDDDATYVYNAKTLLATTGFCFTPLNINNVPTNIKIVYRARTTVANSNIKACIRYLDEGGSVGGYNNFNSTDLTESYTTYSVSIPADYITKFWNLLTSTTISADDIKYHVSFIIGTSSSDSKATADARVTHLYLEVEY